jgi:hypothetical protein
VSGVSGKPLAYRTEGGKAASFPSIFCDQCQPKTLPENVQDWHYMVRACFKDNQTIANETSSCTEQICAIKSGRSGVKPPVPTCKLN